MVSEHAKTVRARFLPKATEEYENFFSLSNDRVYFLGLFWADGHLEKKTNRLSIALQKEDGSVLRNVIEDSLSCRGKTRKCFGRGKRYKDKIEFRKSNFLIADRGRELDFEQKSYVAPSKLLNLIPKAQHYIFWRGLFDGDGCVYRNVKHHTNNIMIASTRRNDWSELEKFASENSITYRIAYRRIKKKRKVHTCSLFYVTGIENVRKFFNAIYPNEIYDGLGLKRKFKKLNEVKYVDMRALVKPKRNNQTKLFYVYPVKSRNKYQGSVTVNRKVQIIQSISVLKCRDFVDKINFERKNYEYINNKKAYPIPCLTN